MRGSVPAAQDAEQDVLATDRGLADPLCLLARELYAAADIACDRELRVRGPVGAGAVRPVAMLAVGGLLGDPEGTRDRAPRSSAPQRTLDQRRLERLELSAQRREGAQRGLGIADLDDLVGKLLNGGRRGSNAIALPGERTGNLG